MVKRTITARLDEKGMISIMVTLVLMMVIILIVVGFTQTTNRSRRQVLDRQLSQQAFYAAESGVNQAVTKAKTLMGSSGDPMLLTTKTTCDPTSGDYGDASANLSGDGGIAVTCLLVNPVAENIRTTASIGNAAVIPLVSSNSGNFTSLTFAWKSRSGVLAAAANATGCPANSASLPRSLDSAGCTYPMLRIDLTQRNNMSAGLNVGSYVDMLDSTSSLYLIPVRPGGTVTNATLNASKQARIGGAQCDNGTDTCTATVILSSAFSNKTYFMRAVTYYANDTQELVIDGVSGGSNASFMGSQLIIDSTGKAQDVVRRVQVRYNLFGAGGPNNPFAALHTSETICKRLTVVSNNDVRVNCSP